MVVRLLNPRPYLYVQYSFEVKGPMTGSSLVSARLVFTLHRFGEKEHYVACMLLKPRPKDDSRVVKGPRLSTQSHFGGGKLGRSPIRESYAPRLLAFFKYSWALSMCDSQFWYVAIP